MSDTISLETKNYKYDSLFRIKATNQELVTSTTMIIANVIYYATDFRYINLSITPIKIFKGLGKLK